MIKTILFDFPMPINTPRLLLRPPQLGDGKEVNAAVIESFAELHRFMPWAKTMPTPAESEEFSRRAAANWILKENAEPYLPLFMFDKLSHEFIGSVGFHHIDWEVPCLELGYWIRKSRSGQGFMTEAVNAVTRYAMNQFGAKRIEIRCDINNVRSREIPQRLGYHLEATLKSNKISYGTGKIRDTLVFVRFDLDNLPNL